MVSPIIFKGACNLSNIKLKLIAYERTYRKILTIAFISLILFVSILLTLFFKIFDIYVTVFLSLICLLSFIINTLYSIRISKLQRFIMNFYSKLKIKDNKIILPQKYHISLGKLIIREVIPKSKIESLMGARGRIFRDFIKINDLGNVNELSFPNIPAKIYATNYYPKIIELPIFLIETESILTKGYNIALLCINKSIYNISLKNKSRLITSIGSDVAIAEFRIVGSIINGLIKYSRPIEAMSNNIILELTAEQLSPYKTLIIREVLAHLFNPGSIEFSYEIQGIKEPILIVSFLRDLNSMKIINALEMKSPVIIGGAWEDLNVKIKLSMNLKSQKTIVDEVKVKIKSK